MTFGTFNGIGKKKLSLTVIPMACNCVSILTLLAAIISLEYVCINVEGQRKPGLPPRYGQSVDDFAKLLDWYVDPCDNLYKFACGNTPTEIQNDTRQFEEKKLQGIKDIKESMDFYGKNFTIEKNLEDPVARLVVRYWELCTNNEASRTGLTSIVKLLKEINEIKSWMNMENCLVSRGLESSFFITHAKGNNSKEKLDELLLFFMKRQFSYHEFLHDSVRKNKYYVNSAYWLRGTPDTIMIDLRPNIEDSDFFNGHVGSVDKYIKLLTEAGLNEKIADSLDEGSRISAELNKNLTNEFKIQDDRYKATVFFRQRYTIRLDEAERYNRGDVYWQDLWDCGIIDSADERPLPCLFTNSTMDWNSYFRDYYWGSAAKSPDEVPLLGHAPPEHWVVTPHLVSALRRFINTLSDQQIRNLILWRTARQLVGYAGDKAKNNALSNDNKCWPKVFQFISSKYAWEKKFPTIMRRKVYEIMTGINGQMKHRIYKNWARNVAYESSKNEYIKRALQEYIKNEPFIEFPDANNYVEIFNTITQPAKDATFIDLALDIQRFQRALLLQNPKNKHKKEDNDESDNFFQKFFAVPKINKFEENRPTSMNYGALGSAIGTELLKRLLSSHKNLDYAVKHTRYCLDQNFPDDFKHYDQKTYEAAYIFHGLKTAWDAYEHYSTFNDESYWRFHNNQSINSKNITILTQEQLFFLSFANSHCENPNLEKTVNAAVKLIPPFWKAFKCVKETQRVFPNECCRLD